MKRSSRVGERMREEVSKELRSLSDPRVLGVVVTRVELTDDLAFCRVFVRRDVGADASAQKTLMRGLESAQGRVRREVSRSLALRTAPELRFVYDSGIDHQTRVEEILREISSTSRDVEPPSDTKKD
ncbi:MAG TPA: 30S ribosome-binding factor RbfA [Polyangiaceae bacterium]|nr:30S ribosome-binding factor RbfA [Polyangiaceae bacterium]